jgi:hypothetical protein
MIPYIGSDIGLHPCQIDCAIDNNFDFSTAGERILLRNFLGYSAGVPLSYQMCYDSKIGRYDFFGGDKKCLISRIKDKTVSLFDDITIIFDHRRFTIIESTGCSIMSQHLRIDPLFSKS